MLKAVFEQHGPVDDVVTFPGRMYAFVNFQHADDAARAQEALDGKEVSRYKPFDISGCMAQDMTEPYARQRCECCQSGL